MNSERFETLIEGLYYYYGRPVNKHQINNWFNEFSGVYDNVIIQAIEAVKHNQTILNFPSPNVIWKAINEIRAAQWQKKKLEEQSTAREFWKTENKSGCGHAAIMLIHATLEGKLSTGGLVEQMYQEDKVYQRAGWKENADALNSFLDYYHEPDPDKRRIKRIELNRLEKVCDAIT